MNMRQNPNTFSHLGTKLITIEISIDFILTLKAKVNHSNLSSPKNIINNPLILLYRERAS